MTMQTVQLGLIDQTTGEMLFEPEECSYEDDLRLVQMLEIATNYGVEMGRLLAADRITERQVDDRVIGFVDGMKIHRQLSATEQEWLRNNIFNGAVSVTNARLWEPVVRQF